MRSNLDAYHTWEPKVHAWTTLNPEALTTEFAVGVKDTINTAEYPTEMGSAIWKGFTPGNDARVVTKLKQAGCVIAGKTVSAEFAVHSPGPTRNPHDLARTPGTSSSGSAVAVATGMVPAALGTQTAGSIIRPASYCGVYAMKPSFGLIPRTGILKTADTLDTVGFFTDTPDRLRTMLDICRVYGRDYPRTLTLEKRRTVRGVGLLRAPCQREWPLYAEAALTAWFNRLSDFFNCQERPWDILELSEIFEVHKRIYHKSLSYYFQAEAKDGRISDIFQNQVEDGRQITPEQYQIALNSQEVISSSVNAWLKEVDILITLSSGGEAPENELDAPKDTCLVWTLSGVPVINIPVFVSPDGMPFGVSIIARKYHDYKLLDFLNTLVEAGLAPKGPNPLLERGGDAD